MKAVKLALLRSVSQLALRAGYGEDGTLTPVVDDGGKIVGTVEFRNGQYDAWSRVRMVGAPGNSHKFLGRFESMEESTSAIRASH